MTDYDTMSAVAEAALDKWVVLLDGDDGQEIWRGPLAEFLAANDAIGATEREEIIAALAAGNPVQFGGGAAAASTLIAKA